MSIRIFASFYGNSLEFYDVISTNIQKLGFFRSSMTMNHVILLEEQFLGKVIFVYSAFTAGI